MTQAVFDSRTVPLAPDDPLYSLVSAYEADEFKDKVDLGVGAYRDDDAKPWILPVVKKVGVSHRSQISTRSVLTTTGRRIAPKQPGFES